MSQSETQRRDRQAGSGVVGRVRPGDLVLIAAVPAVLLAVFALPESTRQTLVFEYTAPTVWTAFAAPFVHFDSGHLAFNLVGYGLVVPVAYLLSAVNHRHWRFRIALVSLVVSCPVLLSYLNLAIVRDGSGVGFSGVLMALYGYLPLALADHLESQFDAGRTRTVAPLLFFLVLTVMTGLTLWLTAAYPVSVPVRGVVVPVGPVLTATLAGLLLALALVVVLYLLSLRDEWENGLATLRNAIDRSGHFELAVVGALLLVAVPFATFPLDPTVTDGVVNLYVHLLGYALGFLTVYLYWLNNESTARTDSRI
ncbi:rhomboid family intramembrane serine protease [Salinibaculum rarum]|uniref:rhomboid family intramembrane serine protease n=1 Tax=Salinibaculum rarum TaxID=3058903 RepID=UPI00265D691B|nr:rhomboid family intramembrane serine protease [Salinibaculum sp. KK48]